MERFERFNSIYRLMVATAVSGSAALLLDDLQQTFKQRSLAWVVLITLVAIALFLLNFAFETLLENSAGLRRLILRDEFIEGHWFDISIDRAKISIHHASFITIGWEQGRFSITGVQFSPLGERLSTFRSTSVSFANRVLTFGYESHGDSFEQVIERGIDQLQFDSPPLSYSGFYFDFTKTVNFRIQGTKIDREVADQFNRFRDIHGKRRFILEQMEQARQKLIADHPAALP